MRHRHSKTAVSLPLILIVGWPSMGAAQNDSYAPPVNYTVARQHTLRPTLKLPGTVQARHRSIIGSETEGIVVALNVREGESVSRGTSLAQLRTDVLEQRLNAARAQLDASKANRELVSRSLERARRLFDTKSMSEQQVDELAYELLGWQAEERRLAAEIAQIELAIAHSHIRAPFDGIIVARYTDIGEWREVGDPIVELISVSDLEVDVAVPIVYFDDLNANENAEVSFPSVSDERFVLEISAVVPVADSEARAFTVKLRLPDDPQRPRIAVGMLADVWLSVGKASTATIVPKDAIVQRQEERLVVVLNDDNQTRILTVLTGNSIGAWIEVQGAIAAGDRVIVRGNERLESEQTVDATPLDYQLP
jgi:RND family efflux transporter MFP subunit